jgi:hypothetical protein
MSWPRWSGWPASVAKRGSGSGTPSGLVGTVAAVLPGLRGASLQTGVGLSGTVAASLPGLRGAAVGSSASAPDLGTPLSAASVFYSGHSLLNAQIAAVVDHIATDRGYSNEYENQMYPASTIWARTANGGNPYDTTTWDGWTNGQNRDGTEGQDAFLEMKNTNRISATDYTHLVIAEDHYSLESLRFSEGLKSLRAYYETFHFTSPSGIGYYYDAWPWITNASDLTDWLALTRAQTIFWEGVATRINDTLSFTGRLDRMATLPGGSALAYLLERATTGSIAGITQGSSAATVYTVIQDEDYPEGDVHLTEVGAYFMGCVIYASLYRRSPVGAATLGSVTGTQATSLQNEAWDFVSAYYTGQPLGPQHDTAARLLQANSFASIYGAYFDKDVPGFQSFFAATNNNNPIYWSTSADVPVSGWWPFPT